MNKIPCIKCDVEIVEFHPAEKSKENPEIGMYDSGAVDTIGVGFGSDFDGNIYLIGICDKCIEKHTDKIKLTGTYL